MSLFVVGVEGYIRHFVLRTPVFACSRGIMAISEYPASEIFEMQKTNVDGVHRWSSRRGRAS
jgi:hypothetical protein